MRRAIAKQQLVLLFSFVIFTAYTLAVEPPQHVKNAFFAHRQRQREARLNAARPSPKAGNLQSHTRRTLNGLESQPDETTTDSNTATQNWAGAVQTSAPSGKFNSVTAQWLLPAYSAPPVGARSGTWYAAELVGIDGYGSCVGASLQAGVFGFQEINAGKVSSGSIAWYEWYPGGQTEILPFNVPAGDIVQVTVTATSLTTGTVVVDNLSTGATVTKSVTPPAPSNTICGTTAEWVVEDTTDANGNLDSFARFDDVHFQNVKATTSDGGGVNLNGATMLNVMQNNVLMATSKLVDASTFIVSSQKPTS